MIGKRLVDPDAVVRRSLDTRAGIAGQRDIERRIDGLARRVGQGPDLDPTLAALAEFTAAGLMVQSAFDTFVGRSIAGTANQITVANGDGVSGNPTISLPSPVTLPGGVNIPGPTRSIGPSPAIAKFGALGTTGTLSVVGTDSVGVITMTPGGTGIAAGGQVQVTFSTTRPDANYIVKPDADELDASGIDWYPSGKAAGSWDLAARTALTSGVEYKVSYQIIEFEP